MGSSDSRQGAVVGFCEHGNDISAYSNYEKLLAS